MKEILEHLYQHKTLSKAEAKTILIDIASGKYNNYQIASFLTAFIMRNITLDELKGANEIFLTGTAAEIVSVTEFDGVPVGSGKPGEVTKKLLGEFRRRTAENAPED